jgi:hypothetical protein
MTSPGTFETSVGSTVSGALPKFATMLSTVRLS